MKKELIKYFSVFIYGMSMLILLSKREKSVVPVTYNKTKTNTYINSASMKEVETVAAKKFFGSNTNFTLKFSENEFSFLY